MKTNIFCDNKWGETRHRCGRQIWGTTRKTIARLRVITASSPTVDLTNDQIWDPFLLSCILSFPCGMAFSFGKQRDPASCTPPRSINSPPLPFRNPSILLPPPLITSPRLCRSSFPSQRTLLSDHHGEEGRVCHAHVEDALPAPSPMFLRIPRSRSSTSTIPTGIRRRWRPLRS